MNELQLRQQLRALRVDCAPPQDLWPAIAPRLAPRRSRSRWLPLALAASLLLALPTLLLLAPPADAPASAAGITREADAMAIHYRAALAELSAAPLPAAMRELADQLDHDAEQLREALESNPRSVELLHQLRRTYDQRLRLNQRVLLG